MSSAFRILNQEQGKAERHASLKGAAASLEKMASQGPRVHCVTNPVAMDISSDILLAVGAQPSMTLAAEEIGEFVACAHSLSINVGTLDRSRREAIDIAIQTAGDFSKPWVLDPVSVYASKHRRLYALGLIERGPAIIRGNYAEIRSLAQDDTSHAAHKLARRTGAVVVQSGEADLVTDGQHTLLIANGDVIQTRVSAMGCATSALIAGFLAVERTPFQAATQALLAVGVAAEEAVLMAAGPGSFHMHLLDRLHRLDQATLERRGRVVRCEDAQALCDV